MEHNAARQIHKRGPPLFNDLERSIPHQGSTPQVGPSFTDGGDGVGPSTSYDAQTKRQHIGPAMQRGLDTPNSPWSTPGCCGTAPGQPGFVTDTAYRGSGQSSSLPDAAWLASAQQAAGEQQSLTGNALLEYCFCTHSSGSLPGSNSLTQAAMLCRSCNARKA